MGMFGYGIFSDNNERWEHSRALLRPQFARQNITDLDALERHCQNLMRHFNIDSSSWSQQVDLAPMFFRLTLDSATEFLFGQSVDSQLLALPGYQDQLPQGGDQLNWLNFGNAFDSGMAHIATKFRFNDLYWIYNPSELKRNIKEVHEFADYFVQKVLDTRKQNYRDEKEQQSDQKKARYVFAEELAQATQDPIELRSQLLHILLAGRDTTAGLLGAIFYHLALNPTIYSKLRKAVLEDFGPYEQPRNMDFAGLKACSYLQYVMVSPCLPLPLFPASYRTSLSLPS
jgi:cytochrome P450